MEAKVVRLCWLGVALLLQCFMYALVYITFGYVGVILLITGMLLNRGVQYLLTIASNVN